MCPPQIRDEENFVELSDNINNSFRITIYEDAANENELHDRF